MEKTKEKEIPYNFTLPSTHSIPLISFLFSSHFRLFQDVQIPDPKVREKTRRKERDL